MRLWLQQLPNRRSKESCPYWENNAYILSSRFSTTDPIVSRHLPVSMRKFAIRARVPPFTHLRLPRGGGSLNRCRISKARASPRRVRKYTLILRF
jgi:hypothetical protein